MSKDRALTPDEKLVGLMRMQALNRVLADGEPTPRFYRNYSSEEVLHEPPVMRTSLTTS